MLSLIDRLLKRKPVADEKIKYRKQQFDYDCGQTCLTMLGYEGYRMFPGKEAVFQSKVAEIFGYTRDQILHIEFNGNTFFNNPHYLTVIGCTELEWHAVVGFKDQIYCPSLGIFKIPDYKKFIWSSVIGFQVPFAEDMKHTTVSDNQE